jgi:hypothetical protein
MYSGLKESVADQRRIGKLRFSFPGKKAQTVKFFADSSYLGNGYYAGIDRNLFS